MNYYDETAEKSILGAAMLDPRVTATCDLDATEFGHAIHGAIWDALHQVHEAHLTPDPATITAHLHPGINRQAVLATITDVIGLGIAGNAPIYAATIKDRAERRRIAAALAEVHTALDTPETPAEDVLGLAEARLRPPEPPAGTTERLWTLDEFLDRDLPDIEWTIPGLMTAGDRLVLTGTEGFGKALALDTPIPTPTGWTTMGDIQPGDHVLGADGHPTRVIAATEVQYGRPCYRVAFSDGSSIIADERHEWLTETLGARDHRAKYAAADREVKLRGRRQQRKHLPAVVETGHIRDTLYARPGFINHSIVTTAPLRLPEADLPMDPYTLGAWLGDGHSRGNGFTCADQGIIDRIAQHETVRKLDRPYAWALGDGRRAPRKTSFKARLRDLGVLDAKHIPTQYLRASYEQRLALLQGLMDTDGSIAKSNGVCEYTGCNKTLVADVYELLMTLGVKATMKESAAKLRGREVGRRWRVLFQTNLPVFGLNRKAERMKPVNRRAELRYIVAVDPVDSVPVRCIQVEAADHLYLAGRSLIPTHNSILMRQIGVCVAAGVHPFDLKHIPPKRVLLIDCENPERIMMSRLGELRRTLNQRGTPTRDRFHLKRYPQGLNLANPRDRLDLHHTIREVKPDLLLIGPAYKLYIGGSNAREEDLARLVTSELDGLREEHGFALILEHHSPHGTGDAPRSVRPIGSSLWLRWPEFGLGLRPENGTKPNERRGELVPWRGSRDERSWPTHLEGGGIFPWTEPIEV